MKAIRDGTVYTMAGPPIENGTVLISNGKITAVGGPELPVPAEAQCIDAAGRRMSVLVTASIPMTLQFPRFGPPDSRRSTPDPVRAM